MPKRRRPDLTPAEKALRQRQAAGRQSVALRTLRTGSPIPAGLAAQGHAAQMARLEAIVDPAGTLPAGERQKRASAGWSAWMRAKREGWESGRLSLLDFVAAQLGGAGHG